MNWRILLLIVSVIINAQFVSADTGIVVDYSDGTVETACVRTEEKLIASEAIELSKFNPEWSGKSIFGRLLCKINDIGEEVAGNFCEFNGNFWAFHTKTGSDWEFASVGLDGYEADGKIIGLVFGDGSGKPPAFSFKEVCRDYLVISKVRAFFNDERETLSANERIEVKPGEKIDFEIKIENAEEEFPIKLSDVKVEIKIEDLGIREKDRINSLNSDESEELEISIEIDDDEDEGTYAGIIRAEAVGEDTITYVDILEFRLQVKKKKHDLLIKDVILIGPLACGISKTVSVEIENNGRRKEKNAKLVIRVPDAGYTSETAVTDLDDDDAAIFTASLNFSEIVKSGLYTVIFEVYDSDKSLNDVNTALLDYEACEEEEKEILQQTKQIIPESNTALVNQPKLIVQYPKVTDIKKNTLSSKPVLGLVLAAYIIVILLGILFIIKAKRKIY